MIKIENLHKSFNGVPVLKGLDLEVRRGETVVIIGRSGCGKSVLLKHIIGILHPDRGRVLVGGVDLSTLNDKELNKMRQRFGMLFQGAALFDSLSVRENVAFSLREHAAMEERAIEAKVRKNLSLVGLEGVEEKKPGELSGGMKKRVGLARALAMDPEVILYDEPTTGLDPIMADAINDLILKLHDRLSVTSFAVTHDMKSAYKIADRIAMLYEGKITMTGSPEEVQNTSNPYVRQFIMGSATGPMSAGDQHG